MNLLGFYNERWIQRTVDLESLLSGAQYILFLLFDFEIYFLSFLIFSLSLPLFSSFLFFFFF